MPDKPKKARKDSQISGLAGEFFVAAELLKREMQTSVTFGNAKAIDLLAVHPKTGRIFPIQVKAQRTVNYFLISKAAIKRGHVYVFVLLNPPGKPVEYFIIAGSVLIDESARFGKWFNEPSSMPGIHPRDMADFSGKWSLFDETETPDTIDLQPEISQ